MEMMVDWTALEARAREARSLAYCPYSGYQVGAAILGEDGELYIGANVENISFGLTICAERSAVSAMVSGGCRRIVAVAVATRDGGTPCGACRQVLAEFCSDHSRVLVLCFGENGRRQELTMGQLLPAGFSTQLSP
jgi:cytidine deaminase